MEPGDVLGDRFEIEQAIRAGGMGEVFRARDRITDQEVAVKVLSDAGGNRRERFAREIELLSELSHPGIVRHVGHGATPDGQLFLVMEWLDGCDLKARLERGSLSLGEVVALAGRVADALGAAHARGIVHRDLKPSNLFLPGDRVDQVKILDFGIAHQRGRTQLTQTGTLIGTPGYMAPEQARTQGAIDARADVFALGCVVFQCLTGAPPFEGDTPIAVLGQILFSDAPRVSALWSEVPDDLDALVARMLAKDPALRPSDGAQLAAAIAAIGPLAHAAAIAPGGPALQPSAITGSERRLMSVVLLGAGMATRDDADDAPPAEALRQVIEPYSSRVERLADGSVIVMLDAERQVATDQAAQAARCALAIRTLAHRRPMAIAMGRVVSTARLAPTLSEGDVIGRACRLLADTTDAPDGLPPIALDEISAGLLDARFDVVEQGAGLVLCGERVLMQGARTLLGRPTSCVGRDWEIGALTGLFDECIEEAEARVVLITAPAGMGKSRLAAEFIARIRQRTEPVSIWVGRGASLRAGSTLDLLAQALRSALGLHGGEPQAERWAQLRARVAEHVAATERTRVAEFLAELIGAPVPADEASPALAAARSDAALMSEQMRRAWIEFLHAEASDQPVLLVLEDLHWGDFGTVRFIDTALRDRRELPWMVLALARPEVFDVFPHLWADRHHVQVIRLPELGKKASERLVRQVLGDSIGQDTIERLVKQADGNAFYLEELIRAVAERRDGALPETVLAMVETRLARLPVEARRVLRAASVFGESCWEASVTALVGSMMSEALVAEWLARLIEQEVLIARPQSRISGERELRFRHALLREGTYATLTDEDRRLGHRLAGDWLEQHGEHEPMVLAGHFERGGLGARAASQYLRASDQALHVLDADACMARANLGLACDPPPELRIALLGMRCEACSYRLDWVAVTMADAEELMRSAPPGSVPWTQGAIVHIQGTLTSGRMADLLATIGLLREVEPSPEAIGKLAFGLLIAICLLDNFGRVVEGTAVEQRFRTIVLAARQRDPIMAFWWNVAITMRASYAHEDLPAGLAHADAIEPIFEATGGELKFINMQLYRGLHLWFMGAYAPAERYLREIVAVDEMIAMVSYLRRFSLAWLLADRGALDEARAVAAELSEYGRSHSFALDEGRGRWVLAEVLRRTGEPDAADREIAIALQPGMMVALEVPGALATLSAIRLAQGRAEDALAAAEDALARCTSMGGCGLFRGAFVRLSHAEALHATGAYDAARRAIADARDRLLAIASRIADPAYRRSFLEEVPENARTLAHAQAWLGEAARRA
ncbi:MAG TPA: protein kinase [Kofleriaceae bacterium]|nr:protein kinase [Kofleriaceae bacterium]